MTGDGISRNARVVGSSMRPASSFFLILVCFVRFGLEVESLLPLEFGFELAPDMPVGVAEMIVDHRIVGLELDGPLQLLHRLIEILLAVIGPPQAVDEIAVIRAKLHCAADQVHRLL